MSNQPSLSHTASASVLLKHRKPAQKAETLLQSVIKDMHSCSPLSCSGAAPGRWGMRAPALQKPQAGERRTLALKDLIATLERDPNYSRSTFLYKLYERLD